MSNKEWHTIYAIKENDNDSEIKILFTSSDLDEAEEALSIVDDNIDASCITTELVTYPAIPLTEVAQTTLDAFNSTECSDIECTLPESEED